MEDTAVQEELRTYRAYIDRIDRTIVALLAERMRQGQALGRLKQGGHWPMRSAEREAEVLEQVRRQAAGPLTASSAARIFALIIEETRALQEADRDAGR